MGQDSDTEETETSDERDRRDPPLLRTERSLPIALLRARERVMGPMRTSLVGSGLNEQKWRVLRVLQEEGPMELTPLAERACLLSPSLTRMVPPMEAEGLVRRTTRPEDRRRVLLAITRKGDELVRQHLTKVKAIFDDIERRFGHAKLELLLDLLEEIRRIGPEGGTDVMVEEGSEGGSEGGPMEPGSGD